MPSWGQGKGYWRFPLHLPASEKITKLSSIVLGSTEEKKRAVSGLWSAYCEPRERKITANLHGRVGTSARRSDVPSDCGRLSVEARGQQQGMRAGASGSQASARGSPSAFKILAIALRCSLSELGCLAGSQEISRRSRLRDRGFHQRSRRLRGKARRWGGLRVGAALFRDSASPLDHQGYTAEPSLR